MAHILIVDDEPAVRLTLRALLLRDGHSVEEAADGRAGVAAARTRRFDLALVDIVMPVLDGLGAMREMLAAVPGLPVIAMSGGGRRVHHDVLAEARTAGAAAILRKPFGIGEVRAAIATVSGSGSAASGRHMGAAHAARTDARAAWED